MLDILIISVAVVLGIVGLLGCILPVLPGPPLSYLGLVVMFLWHNNPVLSGYDIAVNGETDVVFGSTFSAGNEITMKFMLFWLVITIVVTVLDYIVPVMFTRITGGSPEAVRGSIAGTLVGFLFFPPFGIIIGAFVGALLGEIILNNKKLGASLLSAFGSFLGFVFGTGIKLAASGIMLFYIIKFI